MGHRHPNILVHCVFSTKERQDLIPAELLPKLSEEATYCDLAQPAYTRVQTRALYCAICDVAYDPDATPKDYVPFMASCFPPEAGDLL